MQSKFKMRHLFHKITVNIMLFYESHDNLFSLFLKGLNYMIQEDTFFVIQKTISTK